MYEYSTITKSIKYELDFKDLAKLTEPVGDIISPTITKAISQVLSNFSQSQNKLNNEGWEIVSHCLCPLENHLLISLLLRRQLQ